MAVAALAVLRFTCIAKSLDHDYFYLNIIIRKKDCYSN